MLGPLAALWLGHLHPVSKSLGSSPSHTSDYIRLGTAGAAGGGSEGGVLGSGLPPGRPLVQLEVLWGYGENQKRGALSLSLSGSLFQINIKFVKTERAGLEGGPHIGNC